MVNNVLFPHSKLTFSQAGEDMILSHYFATLGIEKPTYLDIGANHPTKDSNTYLFYVKGCRGVCVEPNPVLYRKIKKVRPRDTVLDVGVGPDGGMAPFYVYAREFDGLSTFSKQQADYWATREIFFDEVIDVRIESVNTILKNHFPEPPNLISIDAEGLDYQILQSLHASLWPDAFCIETLSCDNTRRTEIQAFFESGASGYTVYADTNINTIFVAK